MSTATKLSRQLSYILRHNPASAGVTMDSAGWVSVAALLEGLKRQGLAATLPLLQDIVATDDKQRYSFRDNNTFIRANQGHSIEGLELGMKVSTPPAVLYHGSTAAVTDSILAKGLLKGQRHHVHLSANQETALAVAARRKSSSSVIWCIDTAAVIAAGHQFLLSDNGVWLVDTVPAHALQQCANFAHTDA